MTIKDKNVQNVIDRLREHYNIFFSNQFVKYYLLDSKIPRSVWMHIEDLMNARQEYQIVGYELETLYEQILSLTSFFQTIKKEVLPRMMDEAQRRMTKMATDSKILFKMTLDNAPGNLDIFNDLVTELFIAVRDADTQKNGEEKALYMRLPITKKIEEVLHV
ncbi:MAG: hypothetical protein JSV25_07730 [Spirochaetota bacterium]|nr:MAG: hypothetical protein JSV25_07730 [Spirochaetota bacterium]